MQTMHLQRNTAATEAHLGPIKIFFQFEITNSRIRYFKFNSLFQILKFVLTDLNRYNGFVEFVKTNTKFCFNELNSKLRILESVLTNQQFIKFVISNRYMNRNNELHN